MSALQTRVLAGFAEAFGGAPDGVVRAPGRVNLIGEHTDYNDGFVLPCAISVETRIAWRARPDDEVRVVACEFGDQRDGFSLAGPMSHAGGWRDYVRGMIATLIADGHVLRGVELAIVGDIPRGAGLSSSASLEVAVGHAMLAAIGETVDAKRIAVQAQTAENVFVGMKCGVMDQLASAASVEGAALLLDCRSLETRAIPIPQDVAIVIIHSGVVRGLVDGHYNRRRAECEEAAAALGVARLRDADMTMLDAAPADAMSAQARRRAVHIIGENERVLKAANALAANDLTALGQLMTQSHAAMRDLFEITVPPIDELAAITSALIGEHAGGQGGARMTGGGFGGAVVAILPNMAVDMVTSGVRRLYRTPSGCAPEIMITRAAAGAGWVHD